MADLPSDESDDLGIFDRFAGWTSTQVARAPFFAFAVLLILIWAPTILFIKDVDTWQLIVNVRRCDKLTPRRRGRHMGKAWATEVAARFVEEFPHASNDDLALRFGISLSAVKAKAARLGLHKDPAHFARQQREKASGRAVSSETRRKLSDARSGRQLTPEQRRRKSAAHRQSPNTIRGEQHWNWAGGGRPWARYADPAYQEWRLAVLERDGYVCQECGRQCRRREKGLAAHHIKPYASHPGLRLDVNNGVTLCRRCHMALHGRPLPEPKRHPCGCGCGTLIDAADRYGRPRTYAINHHRRKVSRGSTS